MINMPLSMAFPYFSENPFSTHLNGLIQLYDFYTVPHHSKTVYTSLLRPNEDQNICAVLA
jgi:hypothetical protein